MFPAGIATDCRSKRRWKRNSAEKGKRPAGGIPAHVPRIALRYVDQHRRDFKRLGVLGQWEDPYLTMSPQYEATIADAFVTFLEKGYVYRGLKPVYWCIVDRTALAEAEVEYEDHTSPSIWVRYRGARACGGKTRRAGRCTRSSGRPLPGRCRTIARWRFILTTITWWRTTTAATLLLAADLVGQASMH